MPTDQGRATPKEFAEFFAGALDANGQPCAKASLTEMKALKDADKEDGGDRYGQIAKGIGDGSLTY